MGDNDSSGVDSVLGAVTHGAYNPASQAAANNSTLRLQSSQSTAALAKDHGTDASYVQTREAFESMSHQEIYSKSQDMKPANIHQASKALQDIGAMVQQIGIWPHAQAVTRLRDAWTGTAANAAQDAIEKLGSATMAGSDIINAVGLRLDAVAYGAEALKPAIPPPTGSVNPALLPGALLNPGAAVEQSKQQEADRQQAIAAMNAIYKPTFWPAGEGVPTYTPPPQVNTGAGGSGGIGNNGGGINGGGGAGPNIQQAPGQTQQPNQPAPGQGANPGASGGSDSAGHSAQPADASGGNGTDSTKAAGFQGDLSGIDPGMGLGGGGYGGSGGAGGGFGGGGASGPGQLAEPTLGGIPVGGRVPVPTSSMAAARPGAPGMGMPGGASGKKKDEEKEHAIKPYLITKENTEELLGDEQKTSPPVLGAEWDGNQKQ